MSSRAFSAVSIAGTSSPESLPPLYTCHRRALRYCATLSRLGSYLADHGCDREAQVVSHGLLRFFDNEMQQHYADEEEEVFPALIGSMAGADAACFRGLTETSAEQHRALDAQWATLREPLEEVAAGKQVLLPAGSMEDFARLWHDQIGFEEGELLAMASRLLTDGELARLNRRIQARRG